MTHPDPATQREPGAQPVGILNVEGPQADAMRASGIDPDAYCRVHFGLAQIGNVAVSERGHLMLTVQVVTPEPVLKRSSSLVASDGTPRDVQGFVEQMVGAMFEVTVPRSAVTVLPGVDEAGDPVPMPDVLGMIDGTET